MARGRPVPFKMHQQDEDALRDAADTLLGLGRWVPYSAVIGRGARLLLARLEREHGREVAREARRRGRIHRLGYDPYDPETKPKEPEFNPDTVVKGKPRVDK